MAPVSFADGIPDDEPNVVPRHGPSSPPDKNDPHKVYCKDFESIKDKTSNGSPLIEDCLRIIPNIAPPEHVVDWKFMIGKTREIVKYGSCVLAVSANDDKMHKRSWVKVGNMDVISVIEELATMREGQRGNNMGGKTKGTCVINVLKKPTTTEFSIYHT